MTVPALQREEILTALEHVLQWPEIFRSPQLGKFLSYIVHRTLDGDELSIKAYAIAVDVFGRSTDFDPQADPIVRVQARRLRALLDEYNQGPGLADAIQIHLPVGRYVPEFVSTTDTRQHTETPAARPARWSFAASWFTLAFIALGLSMTAYALAAWRPPHGSVDSTGAVQRPSISVVEFQDLAATSDMPPQVAGLAIELVTDLEQFGNIVVRYGGGGEANIDVGSLPTSDYELTGIVRVDQGMAQYSAILTDSRSSSVVWSHSLALPEDEAMAPNALDRVSRSLSLVLGSPRGPLHATARQYLASVALSGDQANAYLCRVLFDRYRETSGTREAERAYGCYISLPEVERESPAALAAVASLLVEQTGRSGAASPADREKIAIANLERALGLEPLSGFVWEQQGRLHERQGLLAPARADFITSLQLNPASVDALAAYARLLAFSGKLDEAERMARDAAERSPSPPAWYFGVPALLALRDEKYPQALAAAEFYAQSDRELGSILAIMAGQGEGDSAVVSRYLPQVLDLAAFRADGILPHLRERITDGALIDSIEVTLAEAGVPAEALNGPF